MRRTAFSWGRLVGPAVVLAILVWRLGTSPFIAGLRTVNGGALAAAAGLAVLTTVCYAWRRKIVAGGLGLDLTAVVYGIMMLVASLPGAVAPVMAWFRRNRPPARAQPPLRGRTAHA